MKNMEIAVTMLFSTALLFLLIVIYAIMLKVFIPRLIENSVPTALLIMVSTTLLGLSIFWYIMLCIIVFK